MPVSPLSDPPSSRVGAPGVKLHGALEDIEKINQILPFASEVNTIRVQYVYAYTGCVHEYYMYVHV